MPRKSGKMTQQEAVFSREFALHGNKEQAARRAGYKHPAMGASRNLQKPDVLAEIAKEQKRLLVSEVLPLAVQRHLQLLQDQAVTGQTLNRAIELAYKYGLNHGEDGDRKDPSQMTPEELSLAINALERAAADQAKDVTPSAPDTPDTSVFG